MGSQESPGGKPNPEIRYSPWFPREEGPGPMILEVASTSGEVTRVELDPKGQGDPFQEPPAKPEKGS